MMRLKWLYCGLLAAGLAATPVWVSPTPVRGAPTTHPANKDKPALRGYYGMVAKDLNLTADQLAKIKALEGELDAWDKVNEPKINGLNAAIAKAKTDKDAVKLKELQTQHKELAAEDNKHQEAFKDGFMALLTPEQKAAKETFDLNSQVMRRLKPADLSEEQKAAAKKQCAEAAKDVLALKPDDAKGKAQAVAKLIETITKTLTPEQQAKVKAVKSAATQPADDGM